MTLSEHEEHEACFFFSVLHSARGSWRDGVRFFSKFFPSAGILNGIQTVCWLRNITFCLVLGETFLPSLSKVQELVAPDINGTFSYLDKGVCEKGLICVDAFPFVRRGRLHEKRLLWVLISIRILIWNVMTTIGTKLLDVQWKWLSLARIKFLEGVS